ncbi:MAG: DNA-binding response regulator [Zetaproteobacteria bacterium]|nr:MAG: DNA-binding response regulator [Zetaproteobacteria bacterium]
MTRPPRDHTVLIVEDDPVVRKFLHLAVDQTPQLQVTASVAGCAEAMDALRRRPAEVLLVDLSLPDGDGIDLIRAARALDPPAECMVVTMHADHHHLVRAIRAGATGYLLKDALPDNIGLSIIELLAGGSPISPSIARRLLEELQQEQQEAGGGDEDTVELSPRELEVLQLMAEGHLRKQIAERLGVSPHTINSHIRRIYRKLEVRNNAAAVGKARRLELIPD